MQEYSVDECTFQIEMPMPETMPPPGFLVKPSGLTGFQQTGGKWEIFQRPSLDIIQGVGKPSKAHLHECRMIGSDEKEITDVILGRLLEESDSRVCPYCAGPLHVKETKTVRLRHMPDGSHASRLEIQVHRYECGACGSTCTQQIPFQAEGHRITVHLEGYVMVLLAAGHTVKDVSKLTGVHRHIIKAIDKKRLSDLYMENGQLKRPLEQARVLGIDEFKLHDGHQYATLIMDLERGHVLALYEGKKKTVVKEFIAHVGLEWMAGVEAVACDMNAGFANAFLEACPHIQIVYDRFHIIKNFNEMVVDEVRKDVQKELIEAGDEKAATSLKRSKYLLTASRETLRERDAQDLEKRTIWTGFDLFTIASKKPTQIEKYEALVASNQLFFTIDWVKEALRKAYTLTDRGEMGELLTKIIDVCNATENDHFIKFGKLLKNHFDGIVSHAEHPYTSGKVEGTNGMIKTLRRKSYGFRDTNYFFLKIIDASRRSNG